LQCIDFAIFVKELVDEKADDEVEANDDDGADAVVEKDEHAEDHGDNDEDDEDEEDEVGADDEEDEGEEGAENEDEAQPRLRKQQVSTISVLV
jgi:hypothetical protein